MSGFCFVVSVCGGLGDSLVVGVAVSHFGLVFGSSLDGYTLESIVVVLGRCVCVLQVLDLDLEVWCREHVL